MFNFVAVKATTTPKSRNGTDNMKYYVYYCTPVESILDEYRKDGKFHEAVFETKQQAIDYVNAETEGEQEVCPDDNTIGHNTNFWFEVYEDDMITEDGDLKDPIFTSNSYYHRNGK